MAGMETPGQRLAEGKTKIIWDIPHSDEVMIESKDDITAGDGAKHDILANKAALATRTTVNCFKLLARAGIPNHFVGREGERMFRAKRVDMIPLECVARRLAFGSYLKRNPYVAEGTRFDSLVFEFFAKDDPNHDPLVLFDFDWGTLRRYNAKQPVSESSLLDEKTIDASPFGIGPDHAALLELYTRDTFEVLEAAWADQGVELVDLKVEGGFTNDGTLVIADVIDNDSWRIWPGGDPSKMMDKQVYRDGSAPLEDITKNYAWVAAATDNFF